MPGAQALGPGDVRLKFIRPICCVFEQFSLACRTGQAGFGFSLLPNSIHARPPPLSPKGDLRKTLGRKSQALIEWNMLTIGFLADYLETIPTLAGWFRNQWPDYYADWSQAEIEHDFLLDASRNSLPSRLVAFGSNELAGTIVLRRNGSETLPEFQPEVG
jgi:hypothetical protein